MTTALIAEDEPLLAQALRAELARAWPELQVLELAVDAGRLLVELGDRRQGRVEGPVEDHGPDVGGKQLGVLGAGQPEPSTVAVHEPNQGSDQDDDIDEVEHFQRINARDGISAKYARGRFCR